MHRFQRAIIVEGLHAVLTVGRLSYLLSYFTGKVCEIHLRHNCIRVRFPFSQEALISETYSDCSLRASLNGT